MGRMADFNQAEVDVVMMDIPITDGRAQDTFLSIDPPRQFETVEGADGLVVFCRTNRRVYPVQLTLLSSSLHNAALSALHAAGSLVGAGGADIGAFLVKDNNGNSLCVGEYCRIMKAPKWDIGELVKPVTWEAIVIADPATMLIGGNSID